MIGALVQYFLLFSNLTTMEPIDFDRVLVHPLWEKNTYDNSNRIVYRFQVRQKATIIFMVSSEGVAMTAIPIGAITFNPEIKSREEAWQKWFRPWCFSGALLEMTKKFAEFVDVYEFEYDIVDLTLKYTGLPLSPRTFVAAITLDENGTPLQSTLTYMNGYSVKVMSRNLEEISHLLIERIDLEMTEV
jgi:hypothetical protein